MILEMGNSTVFRSDFEQGKGNVREELQKQLEGNAYTISTYGEDTEEWREKRMQNRKERSEN